MFRTYEPSRDRLVAVKVFRLDVTPEQAQALADELSRAADAGLFHPSIVEPIAAGVEGTVAYRAEEYVAAESLDVAMRHYAPAALDKALPFITQLAGAIDFARAAGVGHGALHPRDVFVTPDEARATGFGVVEALERVGLRAPVRRPYSAPERIRGEAWSTPADIFSLSAITYELLTGRRPSGTGGQIGPLTGDNVGDNAAALHAVLARAMDDDPAGRYHTALEFAAALDAAAAGGGESARTAAPVAAAAAATAPPIDVEPEPAAVEREPEPVAFEPEPVVVPPEPDEEPDDIAIEREEDEALVEEDTALFGGETAEEERDADAALPAATFSGLAEEFREAEPEAPLLRDAPDIVGLDDEIREAEPEIAAPAFDEDPRPMAALEPDVEEEESLAPPPMFNAAADQDRARPEMLPRAIMLVVGLLAGFLAGWAVFGRDGQESAPAAATGVNAGEPAQQPAQTQTPPQQAAREYSEQAVTPSGAKPPAAPPAVPPEVPTAEPSGRAAAPAPARGRIHIQSTPSGASVTVNGQWRGRTPLTLDDLRFGPYTIRVVQTGYAVVREEFRLSASEPSRTMSVQLRRTGAAPRQRGGEAAAAPRREAAATGSLYVDTRPRGARVFVDGREAGVTPLRLADVAAGRHSVRIELADHRTVTARPTVASGREERVTVSLERIR